MSAALGSAAGFAFAPWHWTLLLVVGLSGLYWLVDQTPTVRRALVLGWTFGFAHFIVGVHWVGESFEVDAERTGALAIPAVLALAGYLAAFPALACAATKALGKRGPAGVVVFAALWTAAEGLRGTLLTGFPWNLVAYIWMPYVAPLQAASIVGVYGLGFLTVVVAALPALAVRPASYSVAGSALVGAVLGVAALWGFGSIRLAGAVDGDVGGVRLRLVQANIAQKAKWDPAMRDAILQQYRMLSATPTDTPATHLIWPESALPFTVTDTASWDLRQLSNGLIPAGGALLSGAVRRSAGGDNPAVFYNSLIAIDDSGSVRAAYDKAHLVPFGEYMPLRGLHAVQKMTAGTVDFVAGSEPKPLTVPGLPSFVPLICYEAIFPGAATDATWLLNITNDAWFGASAGPYQHFAIARMRAVEAGVPLIRVANTGISAVVDAYGRVRASLPLNMAGVLDANLPVPVPARTLYARWKNGPIAITIACVLGWAAFGRIAASIGGRVRPAL